MTPITFQKETAIGCLAACSEAGLLRHSNAVFRIYLVAGACQVVFLTGFEIFVLKSPALPLNVKLTHAFATACLVSGCVWGIMVVGREAIVTADRIHLVRLRLWRETRSIQEIASLKVKLTPGGVLDLTIGFDDGRIWRLRSFKKTARAFVASLPSNA